MSSTSSSATSTTSSVSQSQSPPQTQPQVQPQTTFPMFQSTYSPMTSLSLTSSPPMVSDEEKVTSMCRVAGWTFQQLVEIVNRMLSTQHPQPTAPPPTMLFAAVQCHQQFSSIAPPLAAKMPMCWHPSPPTKAEMVMDKAVGKLESLQKQHQQMEDAIATSIAEFIASEHERVSLATTEPEMCRAMISTHNEYILEQKRLLQTLTSDIDSLTKEIKTMDM